MTLFKSTPTKTDLRWFGLLFAVFNGAILFVFVKPWQVSPMVYGIWAAVVALLVSVYYLLPTYQPSIYRSWLALVFPVAWAFTHLLLLLVYYLCFVPIGWLMNRVGYDPLNRKLDRWTTSYWDERDADADLKNYFKQY